MAAESLLYRVVLIAMCISPCVAGCAGYNIGPDAMFPNDVRTVYVPIFESDSLRRNLGEWLTEAVKKEIERRTPYKVVNSPNADSVLSGRIVSDNKRVVVETRNDDPRETEITMNVLVRWVNRRGHTVGENGAVNLPPEVLVTAAASTLPEVGQSITTAQQEAIQRLAVQIVELMETPW
jgi:hypothetical protein